MILNFKNPLGKSMEKILKDSRRNIHLKIRFFYLFGLFEEDIFLVFCNIRTSITLEHYIIVLRI